MIEFKRVCIGVLAGAIVAGAGVSGTRAGEAAKAVLLQGNAGVAAKHPGDVGIGKDPAVIFTENFETGAIQEIGRKWGDLSNKDGQAMAFSDAVPTASGGKRSLEVTATRGKNDGGHLFTVFRPGHDRLFARFYVKFAPDYGFNHHFVKLQGSINPPRWPTGGAGKRPTDSWTTGIEPSRASKNKYPSTPFPPPGIWHFYTYWCEMHSWQNADGTGTSFYGNNFEPKEPAVIPRDRWICVEFMVRMNSSPERADGEQAFWIDGKPAARFGPGTVKGYWMRDGYRLDEEDARAQPFEGFRWRKDTRLNVNKFWLLNYVTEGAFKRAEEYAAKHPDFRVNTQTATVWFDDIVVAAEYIGPIVKP